MVEIIIIGGGIAGISAAAHLSSLGEVVVLEAEEVIGYHATGRSAAIYVGSYGNLTINELNTASLPFFSEPSHQLLSRRDFMLLANKNQKLAFEKDIKSLDLNEISIEMALGKVPILNSSALAFAAVTSETRDIDTNQMLQVYVKEAKRNKSKIITNAKVTQIIKTGSLWRVVTQTDEYIAPIVVNAAGAWVKKVAELAGASCIDFQPYRRSVVRIPAPVEDDLSDWPMMIGAGESWWAKPDAGKLMVSPSEEYPMEPHDAWADDLVIAEGLARYEEMMTIPVTHVENSWAGLRTFAHDRSLVGGFDSLIKGFFWLGGQGGYGFQTAPAVSELAKQIINGERTTLDSVVVSELSPGRFI